MSVADSETMFAAFYDLEIEGNFGMPFFNGSAVLLCDMGTIYAVYTYQPMRLSSVINLLSFNFYVSSTSHTDWDKYWLLKRGRERER